MKGYFYWNSSERAVWIQQNKRIETDFPMHGESTRSKDKNV